MHLGNSAITPDCVALSISAATAGLGLCVVAARREARSVSKIALAAGLGAFVFAAQTVNVPIGPASSAHLVGGVLLAWALGPAMGGLTMALVLLLQSVILGDGGIVALGANVVNMALIPAGLVAVTKRAGWLRNVGNMKCVSRELAVVSAFAGLSIILAASLVVLEVVLFRSAGELTGWTAFATQMLSIHLLIGVGEAAATAALTLALTSLPGVERAGTLLRPALIIGALAVILALLSAPLSSRLPDGYEYAAQTSGFAGTGW